MYKYLTPQRSQPWHLLLHNVSFTTILRCKLGLNIARVLLLSSAICDKCCIVAFRYRGVTRLDGALGKKQAWRLMFEPEVFRKQMYCIKESTCGIVWSFPAPRSHYATPWWFGAGVLCSPCPPRPIFAAWKLVYWWRTCSTLCVQLCYSDIMLFWGKMSYYFSCIVIIVAINWTEKCVSCDIANAGPQQLSWYLRRKYL